MRPKGFVIVQIIYFSVTKLIHKSEFFSFRYTKCYCIEESFLSHLSITLVKTISRTWVLQCNIFVQFMCILVGVCMVNLLSSW